jgi:hypothetical protein
MVKQDNPKNITFNLGGNIPVEGGKIKRGRKKKVIEPTEVFVKEKLPSQKFSRKKNPALDQLLEANREKERIAVEKAVRDMVVKQTKSQNIYGYGMKGRGDPKPFKPLLLGDSDDEEDPESFNLYEELNKNPIDNIPQFGNLTLKIPPFFAVPTNNNETAYWKLVNPLTEIRNLATRKQKLSVNIKRANVKKPELVDMSVPRNAPRIEDFSPKDQAKLKAYMEAVKQGKEQEYLFKNKPRGFPAVLYKNAKKAGLKETKEKVYTKNKVKKAPAPKGTRGRPKKGRKVLEIEGEEGQYFDPNENDLAVDTPAPTPAPVAKAKAETEAEAKAKAEAEAEAEAKLQAEAKEFATKARAKLKAKAEEKAKTPEPESPKGPNEAVKEGDRYVEANGLLEKFKKNYKGDIDMYEGFLKSNEKRLREAETATDFYDKSGEWSYTIGIRNRHELELESAQEGYDRWKDRKEGVIYKEPLEHTGLSWKHPKRKYTQEVIDSRIKDYKKKLDKQKEYAKRVDSDIEQRRRIEIESEKSEIKKNTEKLEKNKSKLKMLEDGKPIWETDPYEFSHYAFRSKRDKEITEKQYELLKSLWKPITDAIEEEAEKAKKGRSGRGLYKMEGEGDKEDNEGEGGCDGEGSAGSLLGKIGKKVYNTLVKPRVEAVQKNIQRITHPKETLQEAKDFGKNLIYGRNNAYPPSAQKIIDANKDAIVQSVSLRRTPLSSAYTTILSFATKGETAKRIKEQPKDTLYHIAMWVGLSNGKTIKVEKNEVINMVVNPKRPKEEQVLALTNVPANLTFGDMLSKTREAVGDHKFFSYSAKDNNCGNFIEYILKTNGMNNEATNDYIGQDAKAILKGFPSLRKVMNTLTDTAGRANVLLEGGGVSDSDRDYSDSEEEEMEDLEGGSILANQQKKLSNGNYIDMRNHIGHPALMSDLYPRIPQAFTQVHLAHPSPIGSGLYASSGGSLLDNIYGGARHMLGVGLVDKIGRKLDPRRNGAVKLANKTFTPRMGRNIASTLIKDGVPAVVGGVSGATTTALTGNPALGIAVGAVARKYGGNRARDAIGDATGYGMVRNNVRRMSGYGIPDPPSRSPITDPSLLGSGMSKGCGMKGRFVKGSQEAKDYMASIRKKR